MVIKGSSATVNYLLERKVSTGRQLQSSQTWIVLRISYLNFPLLKQRPICLTSKIENYLFMKPCMQKELYVRGVNTINCVNTTNPQKYLCHLFICQPIHIWHASKRIFFYLKSFRIRKTEWSSVRTIDLFKTQSNIYDGALLQK